MLNNTRQQQAAIDRIRKLLGERQAKYWSVQFDLVRTFKRANKVFRRISEATDGETIKDYLAEVRYALIFSDLGFVVGFDPLGPGKVPDLEIGRDGVEAIAEVKRFRDSSNCFEETTSKISSWRNISGDSNKIVKELQDAILAVELHRETFRSSQELVVQEA